MTLRSVKALVSILALSSILLLASGCGASSPGSSISNRTDTPASDGGSPPAGVLGGPGVYVATDEGGAVITAHVPAPASDEFVAEIERLRRAARASATEDFLAENKELREPVGDTPISYVLVEIDNRKGTLPFSAWDLRVVTDDGTQITYEGTQYFAAVLANALTVSGDDRDRSSAHEIANDPDTMGSVQPGATGRTVFISVEAPSSVAAVWLRSLQLKKR